MSERWNNVVDYGYEIRADGLDARMAKEPTLTKQTSEEKGDMSLISRVSQDFFSHFFSGAAPTSKKSTYCMVSSIFHQRSRVKKKSERLKV